MSSNKFLYLVLFITLVSGVMFSTLHSPSTAYAATSCPTGKKLGKTPVSLVVGAAPGCYDVKLAALAKKLLTSDATKSCKLCHAANSTLTPIARVKNMNANLRAQGYTLKPGKITAAFNAHASEMLGATLKSSEAKAISHYLQSIK